MVWRQHCYCLNRSKMSWSRRASWIKFHFGAQVAREAKFRKPNKTYPNSKLFLTTINGKSMKVGTHVHQCLDYHYIRFELRWDTGLQLLAPEVLQVNPQRHMTKLVKINIPGFRSLRICKDLQDFLQGSAKIVALNLEDPYRSARSLQKCADLQDLYRSVQIFFKDFCRNMFFCSF